MQVRGCHPEPRRRMSAKAFAHVVRQAHHDSPFLLACKKLIIARNIIEIVIVGGCHPMFVEIVKEINKE
jgi:hypothetical protein